MRRIMLLGFAALALAAVARPVESQRSDEEWLDRCRNGDYGDSRRERHCLVQVERIRPTGSLTVDGHRNGAVTVYGWSGDSIVVHARIQASAPNASDAREIAEDVRIVIDGNRISADGPNTEDREYWAVHFEIGVPRRTDLRLDVMNGPLAVEDVSGRLELSSHNGPLSIEGVSGDVRARVRNGPLNVELTGNRWEGTGLDAEATNGPAILTIPARYSARLETGTTNGPMVIDYPLTLQGKLNREISTTLGEGGPTVRVVTRNGPLTVRER